VIETVDNTIEADACTAIVLWRPSKVLKGETLEPKRRERRDRQGSRWLWETVIDFRSRRAVASYLGSLATEMLDRKRLEANSASSLPRGSSESYPIYGGKLQTHVKFRYPEEHRINDDSVINGIKAGIASLFKKETERINKAKGTLLRPFPLIVYPFEDAKDLGFRLFQEYAVIGETH
jgi:hypothetical protein